MNNRKKSSVEQLETYRSTREEGSKVVEFPQTDADTIEIDLLDLFFVMLDKMHYIVLCFLIGALFLNAYAYFFIHPTYQSMSKIYVVSSSDDSVVDLTDLNMGTSLTKDYEELILSYPLLNKVIRSLDLNINYKDLADMITLTNPDNTRILRIAVESTDAQLACDIANEVAKISTVYLPETMGTIAPNIAQRAQVAEQKSGPSYTKFTVLGAILGAMICCAYIILIYMLDDTIHSAEDMEKYFGLVPLTTIPDNDLFEYEDNQITRKKTHRLRKRGK